LYIGRLGEISMKAAWYEHKLSIKVIPDSQVTKGNSKFMNLSHESKPKG
jgi:hypothetical protein